MVASNQIFLVMDAGTPWAAFTSRRSESLSKAPARRFHQPAGLHVSGQSNAHAVDHDDVCSAGRIWRLSYGGIPVIIWAEALRCNQREGTMGGSAAYVGMAGGSFVPPAPQLLKGVQMLIVGYRSDRDTIASLLPPGLEPHESSLIQMNMYVCPDAAQTSGFGAFSLTYLTAEIAGHDSYAADGTMAIPGRYWLGYWNSSNRVRSYARESVGIPALDGTCTWGREGSQLVSTLQVGGRPMIRARARTGEDVVGTLGGHLNYYAHRQFPTLEGGRAVISELVEVPIPFVAELQTAEVEAIEFSFPEGSVQSRLAPVAPLQVPSVLYGRVTFTYSMARRVRDYLAEPA
jgi:acetoacetate decarboxylase